MNHIVNCKVECILRDDVLVQRRYRWWGDCSFGGGKLDHDVLDVCRIGLGGVCVVVM